MHAVSSFQFFSCFVLPTLMIRVCASNLFSKVTVSKPFICSNDKTDHFTGVLINLRPGADNTELVFQIHVGLPSLETGRRVKKLTTRWQVSYLSFFIYYLGLIRVGPGSILNLQSNKMFLEACDVSECLQK